MKYDLHIYYKPTQFNKQSCSISARLLLLVVCYGHNYTEIYI